MSCDTKETETLLRRAGSGDRPALDELFAKYRERLHRMVRLRLDGRLRGRIDASDVIQEAHLEAWRRLDAYLGNPRMPFFLWLRFLTGQKLLELHRHHLGAQRRDARQEVRLHRDPLPEATSDTRAHQLMVKRTTPIDAAVGAEMKLRLQEALNRMDAMDREVLALRHFEQLSNVETAQVLGIKEGAASQRYVRAFRKLEGMLMSTPQTRSFPTELPEGRG